MASNPHDALFRATFSQPEHAAGELRHALPAAISARLDFSTLTLEPGSFVDEELQSRYSDLLFSIQAGKTRVLLYVLFEHQSTVDALMAFRLLRYMMRIWDRHLAEGPGARKLPVIVPVVLHHSATGWTAATAFEELLDADTDLLAVLAEHVPRFRFAIDDISHVTDEELRGRAMSALGRLALYCFRHAREPRELVARLGRWLDLVREVRRAPNGAAAMMSIWRYIVLAHPGKPEEAVQELLLVAGNDDKEEIVTAGEQLIERGRQTGLQEGQRRTLLRQLASRFGDLPQEAVARVQSADAARLDLWTDRVLTAPTLDEVLRDA